MRTVTENYEQIHVIQAQQIESVALNKDASVLASVSYWEGKVNVWDVKQG